MRFPFLSKKKPPVSRLRDAAEAFEESTRRRRISAQRLNAYRLALSNFAAWAGRNRRMDDIRPEEADAYAARIPHYLAAATYNDKISALRTAWATLMPEMPNPWRGIQRRPGDSRPREPISREEIESVVAEAAHHGRNGGELAMLIHLGAWTGLRLGDAVRLRWEAIGERTISVRTRKTGASVAIPILKPLREALDEWRKKSVAGETGDVFPRLHAAVERNHGHTANVAQKVCLCMRRRGLETSYKHEHSARRRPLRGYHSLRHTYVTALLEAGIPVDIVAAIVGHAAAKMTAHYTHARDEYVREQLGKAGLL